MRLVRHHFLYVWYLVLLFVFSSFFHGGNRLLSYCVLYHYEGMNGVQICYHHANVGDVIDSFEDRSRIGYLYNGTSEIPFSLQQSGETLHVYYLRFWNS